MDYNPMKMDVFGLVDVFKMDLIKELDNIMPPPCDADVYSRIYSSFSNSACDDDNFIVNVTFAQEDCDLAMIRSDAFDEFSRNGVEQDLDEVDVFQSRLRERTLTRPVEPENPVAVEYMVQKRRKSKKKAKTVCVFCKNNNESAAVYNSHVLKDSEGRTVCPILRKYTCPICSVSGDEAHTIRYCPKNVDKDLNPGLGLLMKSPHLSTGKVNPRYCKR